MEVIVTGGCSWSTPRKIFLARKNISKESQKILWNSWVEKLNFSEHQKLIHTGYNGNSVPGSVKKIFDQIMGKKVDRVVLGISDWYRIDLQTKHIDTSIAFYTAQTMGDGRFPGLHTFEKRYGKKVLKYFTEIEEPDEYFLKCGIDNTLRHIRMLSEFCALRQIKFHAIQILDPLKVETIGAEKSEMIMNHIVNHEVFKYIEKNPYKQDFLGYPFVCQLGGTAMEDVLRVGMRREDKIHRISDVDGHPNDTGHNIIAEWFHKHVTA